MSSITTQQTKLDLELVPKEKRLEIGKCNGRINPGKKQREPTFQVVLDALALTPCYSTFLTTTDVPEVYMHQFWDSIHKYENSYRFRIDKKKKFDLNLEIFKDIFHDQPKIKQKQLNLRAGTERMIFNIDSAMKHIYSNDYTYFSIDAIDEILEEDFDSLLDEGSKILHSFEGTLLEEEIFVEFDEFMAMTADENSNSESDTEEPPFEKITINTNYKIKTSLEEPLTDLELKPLPDNLEYVFVEEPSFLPVIISSQLTKEKKNKLVSVLKKHKQAFAWKTTDIPVLNLEKCHFMVKEGIVLGHKVSSARLEVDKAKIDIILKLPPPANIKGIKSFLGHAGFFRRFIKYFLNIARPLTKLLEKDTPFEFDDECQKAFELLKEKLKCAPVIVSLNWNLPFELMCDANDFTVGAVLGQKDALRHLFKKQDAKPRLIRWIILLQQFDIEIKDRKGTENVVAGHLSRIENDEMPKALISDRGTHFYNKIMERTMKRYGVNHCFSTSYHPQTNGQVENTNRALKIILEKTVKDNPAIWSRKLDDALMGLLRTAYKQPTGTSLKIRKIMNYQIEGNVQLKCGGEPDRKN
ncbi:reverse transcriptase domain-containing protein [Tanacetum coccineum]